MKFIEKWWKTIFYSLLVIYTIAKFWLIPSYKPTEYTCTDITFSANSALSNEEKRKMFDNHIGMTVKAQWLDRAIKLTELNTNSKAEDFVAFTKVPDKEDTYQANYGDKSYTLSINRKLGLLWSITINCWQRPNLYSNDAKHHSTVTLKP